MNDLKIAPDVAAAAIPFKVRLEPYLIESVCELSRVIREKGSNQTDVSGLLYGAAEKGSRIVVALKTFQDAGTRSDLARRERLEKAYIAAVEEANEDPELSSLQLIGWFSFRNGSGLLSSDVVFHNQHFRKSEDLAVVVWREGNAQITAEVYSKSGQSPMTSSDYRWSSVRLSSEIRHMSEPIDLAMRVKLSDDSFLRAYDSEPDEPENAFENLKKRTGATVGRLLTFLQIRPKEELYAARVRGLIGDGRLPTHGWNAPPAVSETLPELTAPKEDWRRFDSPVTNGFSHPPIPVVENRPQPLTEEIPEEPEPTRPAAAAAAVGSIFGAPKVSEPQRTAPEVRPMSTLPPIPVLDLGRIGQTPRQARAAVQTEVSGLPMVIRPAKRQFPWQWVAAAAIVILCSAAVFAVFAFSGLGANNRLVQNISAMFSGSDLNLRVRSEDDRLRLTWNPRNPAVASATDGTLQILDGTQRRNIHLEGRQVADGSVLYRPLTNDVTFRLEVHGEQGSTMGSLRVLDGPQGRQPVLDVSDPQAAPADPALSQVPTQAVDGQYSDTGRYNERSSLSDSPAILRRGAGGTEAVTVPVPSSSAPASDRFRSASTTTPSLLPDPAALANTPYTARLEGTTPSDRAVQAPSPLNEALTNRTSQTAPPSTTSTQRTTTPGLAGTSTINGWDSTPEPVKRRRPTTAVATVSDFVPPQPLLQVTPNTKSLAAGAVQSVTRVEVQVRVDQTGHVAYARVLNASNIKRTVSQAALNAARQWTFQAATMRGQRVESDHTIVFEFRPQR